jgi:tetratricopeptide (TPR) repeat protein
VGSSEDPNDPGFGAYFNADLDGSITSQQVTGLPTDGSAVYVKLYSYFPDLARKWQGLRYAYVSGTASGPSSGEGLDPTVDAFSRIVDLTRATAPYSVIAQQARLARLQLYASLLQKRIHDHDMYELGRKAEDSAPISAEEWDALRSMASDVIAHNSPRAHRAAAQLRILEADLGQGRFEEALAASEAFFGLCDEVADWAKCRVMIVRAHHTTAAVLQRLGRREQALSHYRWTIQALENESKPIKGLHDTLLPEAYYQVWLILRQARAVEAAQAAQDVLTKFPETGWAKNVRWLTRNDGP